MPCTYIDAVSMYPAALQLLNLWFDQVIPARLEPEGLDPAEVQTLLDELQRDRDGCLTPSFGYALRSLPRSSPTVRTFQRAQPFRHPRTTMRPRTGS